LKLRLNRLSEKFMALRKVNQGSEKERPIIVVAGLIHRGGRLLICQRGSDGDFPLKWEFPGGKVEKGESDIDALRRELREELAVDARQAEFFCRYDHSYPKGPAISLRFYEVSEFDGEPQNLIFQRIVWADIVELERFDFLEGDRPIIARLMAEYGHGSDR
jgi:mutator protein MutT